MEEASPGVVECGGRLDPVHLFRVEGDDETQKGKGRASCNENPRKKEKKGTKAFQKRGLDSGVGTRTSKHARALGG